jgi:transglutaminase-like putative cysteine protease
MKLNPLKLIIIIGLITSNLFSQDYKLGKVTVEELKEKRHPIDSSAAAAILFKKGDSKFEVNSSGEWTLVTDVDYKIKIYKKEGLDNANQEVYYYVGGAREETLRFKNAVTYNLVDGKIEKTKLKSDGEFKEEINEDNKVKKITMPQVKEGSIIEYSYTLRSPFIMKFDDWYFQSEIPVNHVEYSVYVPKYFKYRTVITGYESVSVEDVAISTGSFPQQKYTYTIENVPALKEENFVTNIKNYTSILKNELVSISYPGQPVDNIALDWDGVVKTIYDDDRFGKELKSKSYFEDDLKIIIEGLATDKEKIQAIYKFVQNKMNWNENNGVFTKDGVRKAYKNKTGNVAEINLILIAMLKEAGIEANPILVSTRKNGIALYPNRTAFNYVVAGIEVQDDVILLDATNKNLTVGMLPLRAVNWYGRIVRERGSSNEIDLLDVSHSNENVIILGKINAEGKIEGKLRRQLTRYNSLLHRDNYSDVSEDSYIEKLENKYKSVEIGEYKVDNLKEVEKPVVETYSFVENNSVEIIGNKMYISPLMFFTLNENPFKVDERKYPVDFHFPFKDSYNVSLTIPDGYEVEFLPEASSLLMENGYGVFRYNVSSSEKSIQMLVNFDVNAFYVPSQNYATLKNFFKIMIEKQTEKIILIKK